ncbi:MAG: Uncharacterised protein [Bacteroidota bacterium]|nr:MAG: Uncharacterised protein [Bacteroidota bacterium]
MVFQRELYSSNEKSFGYSFQDMPIRGPPGTINADLMLAVVGVDITKENRQVGGKPIDNMTVPFNPIDPIYFQSGQ